MAGLLVFTLYMKVELPNTLLCGVTFRQIQQVGANSFATKWSAY